MAQVIESYESIEITRTYDESVIELRAHLTGDEDTVAVESEFYTWLGSQTVVSGGFLRQTNIKHLGGGVHEATATFAQYNSEVVKTIRYRTTGQTARIIQGFGTVWSDALVGNAPNMRGLINVTKDGVEGVDIPVPHFSFSIDYRFSAVDQMYLDLCHRLTGCVNNAPYLGFDAGELLFMGIEGEIGMTAGGAVVMSSSPISFQFEASPNWVNLAVGPFTVPFKYGWDYMWTRHVEDTDAQATIKRPSAIYVDRVHRFADLSLLGV